MPSIIRDSETTTRQLTGDAVTRMRSDMIEIRDRLKRVKEPRNVDNLLRTSILAGARVVRDHAKENVVEQTGGLKKAIIARTRRRRRGDESIRATVTINPKMIRERNIAHLVEFGTSPHEQAKLNFTHPGAYMQPFLRPAADENHEEIFQAVADKAKERLEKLNV